jgi:hypothetical protein
MVTIAQPTLMRIRIRLFTFDADPEPGPHESDATLRPLVCRPSHGSILSLHASTVSVLGPPCLHPEPLTLQNFNFNPNPDQAFTAMRIRIRKPGFGPGSEFVSSLLVHHKTDPDLRQPVQKVNNPTIFSTKLPNWLLQQQEKVKLKKPIDT